MLLLKFETTEIKISVHIGDITEDQDNISKGQDIISENQVAISVVQGEDQDNTSEDQGDISEDQDDIYMYVKVKIRKSSTEGHVLSFVSQIFIKHF